MAEASQRANWLDSLVYQTNFYQRTGRARRLDPEFEWKFIESIEGGRFPTARRMLKGALRKIGLLSQPPISIDWVKDNAYPLWHTRELLSDELSRLLYDSALVLRLTHHRSFYFPRIDFDDLIEIYTSAPFRTEGLPHEYLGVPLEIFEIGIPTRPDSPQLKIVTRRIQLSLMNSYRQYLIRRDGFDISPKPGEVVYDCGACIGEISLLFAGLVAPAGEVHLFDPMPLHTRFCEFQASMNPQLAKVLHINTCAVGASSHDARGTNVECSEISPGAISTDDFSCTSLDDYSESQSRVADFIKMDIEGAELEALTGASKLIREAKPRLAISGYHKPEDLWEIPIKIMELNPGYQLTFGHHTPIMWESVFYAFDPDRESHY